MALLGRLGRELGETANIMGGNALLGAPLGAIAGAGAANPENGGNGNYGNNMLAGALGGAGATAGVAALGGGASMIKVIFQALKRQHPEVPDEMIMQKAQELAQQMGQQGGQPPGGMMPPMGGGM